MFGMGMGEIVLIAIVALLVVGPERLPGAAKAIGKGIRDLRKQTKDLQDTIEKDSHIGEAVKELRGALRGDPETLYKKATGEDFREPPKLTKTSAETGAGDGDGDGSRDGEGAGAGDGDGDGAEEGAGAGAGTGEGAEAGTGEGAGEGAGDGDGEGAGADAEPDALDKAYANSDDGWGTPAVNPHVDTNDPDLPPLRTPGGALARGDDKEDRDPDHG
jgi:Tat protein translocase TatB subunit